MDINKAGIYCITHSTTGRIYIGSAVNFRRRFNEHKNDLRDHRHKNPRLQKIFNQEGIEYLKFTVIELVSDESKLKEREQFWLDTLRPQLNVLLTSANITAEQRKKLSGMFSNKKRRPLSEETRLKISIANTGKKHSEETKKKLSESHKGKKLSAETKAKLSAIRKGRKGTSPNDETRKKIREAVISQWQDPAYRRKHKKATRAAMKDPEVLRRLSESHKGKRLSAEHRKKIGDLHRGMKRSAATRKRLSEARRLWWKRRKAGDG